MATRNTPRPAATGAYLLVSAGAAPEPDPAQAVSASTRAAATEVRIQLWDHAPVSESPPGRGLELPEPVAEAVGSALRRLADALAGIDARRRDDEVQDGWGPTIDAQEAQALERENLHLQARQRREQLTASFSRAEVAQMLDVSTQTVSDMRVQNRLIGLRDGREWRFPAWQFTPDDAEPVLPDLARLVREFPGGVVSLSRWMTRPNVDFDGRTPQQEMLRDREHVFAVINALTAA
ncbi:helix-turn-helix domain-containing protein [Rhodococcus aetherivorans]|uniref:helix-turn-helix domain-containing protein n=1 Tax=Rhodococcus aetherivorans TaxID=191292 RepID=UPI001639A0B6|nr:helix-turn-helix domain-containing protein [Rhodococcus aetherivorans]MBC2592379.1 helix-turn-helix domain-containing protein [Rhodococcus aetherivorans]